MSFAPVVRRTAGDRTGLEANLGRCMRVQMLEEASLPSFSRDSMEDAASLIIMLIRSYGRSRSRKGARGFLLGGIFRRASIASIDLMEEFSIRMLPYYAEIMYGW